MEYPFIIEKVFDTNSYTAITVIDVKWFPSAKDNENNRWHEHRPEIGDSGEEYVDKLQAK
jgi:hypothetical protein